LDSNTEEILREQSEYRYGFVTEVEMDRIPKGLSEDVIRLISEKKQEPDWMLEFRLKAYHRWLEHQEPHWANVSHAKIDYQNLSYYSAPKKKATLNSLDEVDPEILRTFERLGIPLDEQKKLANVAVDVVFDSVSVPHNFSEEASGSGRCAVLNFRSYPPLPRPGS
jgi:Fe-S cluster assembly protein SufB